MMVLVALAPTERWTGGYVVDTATGMVVTTTVTAGASWWGGFLRDADGRLVIREVVGGEGVPVA